ncbi:MAG: diacylglycerol kinase family protein [Vicinamibacterales bacterium]
MRAGVILNPRAGRAGSTAGLAGARADFARAVLARHGASADVRISEGAGHAAALARACLAAGADVVIAWGGDGTINEVAGPLIGGRVPLAIVPGGSGDGLARSLGLPRRAELALRLAVTGPRGPMDVGWIGPRHFLNLAGIGFDAAVADRFNRRGRRGLRGYVTGALRTVWGHRPGACTLALDDRSLEGPRFVVVFANGSQYGSGLVIAPDASPWDGWLNLVVVDDGSPLRQIWRARRLFIRPLDPAEGVLRAAIRTARISGSRLLGHVDGESFTASGTLDVRLDAGALLLAGLAPR